MKPRHTGRAMSLPGGLALGAGSSLILTILFSAILGKLIQKEYISEENIGYGVMILLAGVAFLSAVQAAACIKHQWIAVCFATGVIYLGILLSITALFFGGQYGAVGESALMIFGGSFAAALIQLGRGKSGSRKRRIRR